MSNVNSIDVIVTSQPKIEFRSILRNHAVVRKLVTVRELYFFFKNSFEIQNIKRFTITGFILTQIIYYIHILFVLNQVSIDSACNKVYIFARFYDFYQ